MTILSVGRLERYKGHDRLIAALPYLLRREPDVRAVILGTGPDERRLRELAVRLGVARHLEVTSIPAGDRQAMAHRIARADLVVLLSEYEAHPVSLLEAASLHRPLLVAKTSGLTELVEAGLAHGIAPDAPPSAIADAMHSAVTHGPISPHVELPTWDDTAASLLSVYESCLTGSR